MLVGDNCGPYVAIRAWPYAALRGVTVWSYAALRGYAALVTPTSIQSTYAAHEPETGRPALTRPATVKQIGKRQTGRPEPSSLN
ncbi:hypothetical protein JOD55_000250 [Arcanobacterium pluranimalium]|nr:hypothetical protein [Arcanobacterium pluranimalium]